MQKTKNWSIVAFVALLVGIGVSIYLTSHHYGLIYLLSETKSFCNVSNVLDCDAVNTSVFSEMFGVPVALIGLFTYIVQLLFLLGLRALEDAQKPKLSRFFFYLTWAELGMSVYLGIASYLILKTVCLFCATLYVVSILLFISGYKMLLTPVGKNFVDDIVGLFKVSRGVLFLMLLIPVGSVLANEIIKQSIAGDGSQMSKITGDAIAEWKNNRKFDFALQDAPFSGDANAPNTVVEFFDFRCSHCKRAALPLHAFVNGHRKDVRLVYQNYPLDPSCNSSIKNGGHDKSCLFARVALCAGRQNKYHEAYEWIFDRQDFLSDSSVEEMCKDLKLDAGQLKSCVDDPATAHQVVSDVERGQLAELQGTPSIFFNGKLLPSGFLIPVLEAALRDSH